MPDVSHPEEEGTLLSPDPRYLIKLYEMRMPFGKYSGTRLVDLPEPYVVWFSKKGFPSGKLGEMLKAVYEIKLNGLEYLFEPLRKSSNK
ncbi:MAG: DUF3820 family protein [Deltaproteobacteria bacterium]|nr:DUF3820 family protein [Deltaproteobacteria bacterium]